MKKRELTKLKIQETAIGLFLKKGIDQTSVDEIVTKSGVAKGTFFYHYKQKDILIEEIITNEFDGYFSIPEVIVNDQSLNAAEKMSRVLSAVFVSLKSPSSIEKMFIHGVPVQFQLLMNEIRLEKMIPIIRSILIQGNVEGCFRVQHVQTAASVVTRGISAHIHAVYAHFSQPEILLNTLAGIEELVNNVTKTSKSICIEINL